MLICIYADNFEGVLYMTTHEITFGKEISRIRKELNLSQKELAEKVLKEDNQPITPQYLNDIEHDRRRPSSDALIKSFAKALNLKPNDEEYLSYLAGNFPEDLRDMSKDKFTEAILAFRKTNK